MLPRPFFLSLRKSAFLFFLLALPLTATAERNDRGLPIELEADRITVDDIKRIQTLEGHVVLKQGTLTIRSDKIVITEDAYGFQHGIATGGANGLATFRQKRDNSEEWVEGESERIEYDTRTEVAELFRRAFVKSGRDQLKGDYIWYDAISERYRATSGGENISNPGGTPPRVSAIIHPKNSNPEQEESTPAVPPPPAETPVTTPAFAPDFSSPPPE